MIQLRKSVFWVSLLFTCLFSGEAFAQTGLMSWLSTRDLVQPALSKERELMGQAHRNTLFIEVKSDPGNVTNMVNLAVVYERLGEHAKALGLYREVAQSEAYYPVAISGFIKNMYLSGNSAGTLRFIRVAESRHALEWDALLIKAELLVAGEKVNSALQVMENAWLKYLSVEGAQATIVNQVVKRHLLNNLGYLYQQSGNPRKLAEVRAMVRQLGG